MNKVTGFILAFALGWIASYASSPLWKAAVLYIGGAHYQELTYRCDRVMRNHMIAKQRLYRTPHSAAAMEQLHQAEIGLIDCQDYDLFRKRLIRWGLDENDLSTLALETIENKDTDLQKVIETHEIRY